MGNSRCTTCGSVLPGEARFCPGCGAGIEPVGIPVLDLAGPPDHPEPDDTPSDRSVATVVGVVLGVIAVIVLLSLVAGGGSDGDDSRGDQGGRPTTTTPPRTATTTTPSGTESAPPRLLVDGDSFDPDVGMAAVWIRSNGSVVVADLSTGAERVLDERLAGRPIQGARWTGDTFLIQSINGGVSVLLLDGSDEFVDVESDGYYVDVHGMSRYLFGLFPQSSDRRVAGPAFGWIDADGRLQVVAPENQSDFGSYVMSSELVDGRAAVSTWDGIYLFGADGSIDRIGTGRVLGAEGSRLVRRSCDEQLECRLFIDDIREATTTDLGLVDVSANLSLAVPSPDGSAVAVVASGQDGTTYVRVIPVETPDTPLTFSVGQHAYFTPWSLQWSTSGDWLVWNSPGDSSISGIRWRNGEISTEPTAVALPRRRLGGVYEEVFVVPLDRLPPGWVPAGERP